MKSCLRRKIFFVVWVLMAVLGSSAGVANCETITVRADGTGDYPTIQAAIDDANEGDEVVLEPGTYTGTGNRDIDFLGKAITVQSTDPNDPNIVADTIIDCNGTESEPHRGFYFDHEEDADSVVAGLTIINGYVSGNWYEGGGGGIYCRDSKLTIVNCTIRFNSAVSGGGIFCWSSRATISNCTIGENSAEWGGGILCIERATTITDCTISGNMAIGGTSEWSNCGGGIYCGRHQKITNCTISDNLASSGGGIFCYENPTINNCTISGNRVQEDPYHIPEENSGGGLFGCEGPITNCTISNNISEGKGGGGLAWCQGPVTNCVISNNNTAGDGGGLWECSGPITNCIIIGNKAGDDGGGLAQCDCSITNCTIADNKAGDGGGGLHKCDGPISNCILWDNWPQQISLCSASVTYSNVQGGWPGQGSWPGQGNINADPLFAFSTDYHLMPGSPCIDASDPNYVAGPNETDLDGNPRILDGDGDGNAIADMGAYEYNANSPSIAVSPVSFSYIQNGPKPNPKTLQIRNCGGGTLNWQIAEDCNWLQVTPTNGVSTGQINEVTLTVEPNSLPIGYYSCILTILDSNAVNSPLTIQVPLYVGTVLRVPSQDYPTIQAAIDAANDYDVVLVADGNYTGEGNKNLNFHGKAIAVCSENGPNNCIIDCQNSGEGFYFQNGETENSVVDGFTITNGYSWCGGGIFCGRGSSPTINRCVIKGNSAFGGGGGGGVYCHMSNATITDCTITGNSADRSGGGISCWDSSPVISNCTITNNTTTRWGGGGIYCDTSSPTITNCTIRGNSAERGAGIFCDCYSNPVISNCTITSNFGSGISCEWYSNLVISNCTVTNNTVGGIFCFDSNMTITGCTISGNTTGGGIGCSGSNPTIINCTVTGNSTEYEGGGISCWYSSPKITDCTIGGNTALGGGGITVRDGSSPTITNCTITNNIATAGGGGGILCRHDGSPAITNCTISGNRADLCGGGISCYESSPIITNCILWGSEAPDGPQIYLKRDSNASVSYTDVEGGEDDVYVEPGGVLNWGTGNIDLDPCFVDPNASDYHLSEGSPCIDAGTDAGVYDDIEGNVRPFDYPGVDNNEELPEFDMGAYEMQMPPLEVAMHFTPQALNPGSKGKWVKAHVVLPEGYSVEDVDANEPAQLEPLGIESEYMNVFVNEEGFVEIEIGFERSDLCGTAVDDDVIDVTVVGLLTSGQEFVGTDTIRIIAKDMECLRVLSSYWLEDGCGAPDWCGGVDLDHSSAIDFVDFALSDSCYIEVVKE